MPLATSAGESQKPCLYMTHRMVHQEAENTSTQARACACTWVGSKHALQHVITHVPTYQGLSRRQYHACMTACRVKSASSKTLLQISLKAKSSGATATEQTPDSNQCFLHQDATKPKSADGMTKDTWHLKCNKECMPIGGVS